MTGSASRRVSAATAAILLLGGLAVGTLSGLVAGAMAGLSLGRSRAAAEYEPRITALEDEKLVLEAKVTDLEAELELARASTALRLPGGIEIPRSLDDLRDLNILQRPFLGVRFEPYEPGRHGALPGVTDGVFVVGVEPDSGAHGAGILVGDVIVGADAEPVHDPAALSEAVAVHDVGDTMVLALVRDGERRSVRVTLGGRRLGLDVFTDDDRLTFNPPHALRRDLESILDRIPERARDSVGGSLGRLQRDDEPTATPPSETY